MKPDKDFKYNTTEFFKKIAELHEYRVGKSYFFLRDGKIDEGTVCTVKFEYSDPGVTHTGGHYYNIELSILLSTGGSKVTKYPRHLFVTREEAAEQFLKENDIPSELLKVLKQEKPKTTVADLLDKLSQVDPDTDLNEEFWPILKIVEKIYIKKVMPDE